MYVNLLYTDQVPNKIIRIRNSNLRMKKLNEINVFNYVAIIEPLLNTHIKDDTCLIKEFLEE